MKTTKFATKLTKISFLRDFESMGFSFQKRFVFLIQYSTSKLPLCQIYHTKKWFSAVLPDGLVASQILPNLAYLKRILETYEVNGLYLL